MSKSNSIALSLMCVAVINECELFPRDAESYLVFWPEEQSVTVVPEKQMKEGSMVGDACKVKVGLRHHCGVIKAVGKNFTYTFFHLITSYHNLFN